MLQNDHLDCLISYMRARQKAQGLTVHQYAELANVPENTINNIYYKKVDSVKIDVAARLVHALGGSLDEAFGITGASESSANAQNITSIQIQQPATPAPPAPDKYLDSLKEAHQRELSTLQTAYEREIKTITDAHSHETAVRSEHLRDIRKSRDMWCMVACALMAVICGWLVWDLIHPHTGMIRYASSLGTFVRLM